MSHEVYEQKVNKKSLVGVLFLLISVLVYVFFVRSMATNINESKAMVLDKTKEALELKVQLGELQKAEEELDLSTEVARIAVLKSIPTQVDQDQLIKDLINIADEYAIALKSISFSKGGSPDAKIGSISVSASFEGNYLDLIDFLHGLESNARILKVNSISVQLSKSDFSDLQVANFSLNIETFYQQ